MLVTTKSIANVVNVLLGRGGVVVCVYVCVWRGPQRVCLKFGYQHQERGEGRGEEGKLWEHVNYPNIWTFKDLEFYFTHSIHVKQCTSWFARL